jgi:hypothetical protein
LEQSELARANVIDLTAARQARGMPSPRGAFSARSKGFTFASEGEGDTPFCDQQKIEIEASRISEEAAAMADAAIVVAEWLRLNGAPPDDPSLGERHRQAADYILRLRKGATFDRIPVDRLVRAVRGAFASPHNRDPDKRTLHYVLGTIARVDALAEMAPMAASISEKKPKVPRASAGIPAHEDPPMSREAQLQAVARLTTALGGTTATPHCAASKIPSTTLVPAAAPK